MCTENREKGTSTVEFVLLLPLLLLVLFAIIEFGFILYDKAVITNASREGARRGILMRDPRVPVDTIVNTVNKYSERNLISFGPTTTPSTTVSGAPCAGSDSNITVTVAYPYSFLVLPNFSNSVAGQINLTAVTVMRCEGE
jgi:Flp pilus assembly protein TadG